MNRVAGFRYQKLDGHAFALGKADGFVQQSFTGLAVPLNLCDVDRFGAGVETDEADDILVDFSDAHRSVVDKIAHDVLWSLGQLREVVGVGFDGVPDVHTVSVAPHVINLCGERTARGDGVSVELPRMDTVIPPERKRRGNDAHSHGTGDSMRVVAKFGGTSLGNGERINRAADSIAKAVEQGHEVAVVASAMGNTTDELLDEIEYDVAEEDRAQIVSMGERTSVRMLKGALSARGIEAVFLEPGSEQWPIITDEYGEVDIEETTRRAHALAGQMGDIVPVITGFLAQDLQGNVTTLGRGGSDTTAVMLGKYMDADEVVIVTDVEGVMTGDPRVVEGARNVGEITVDELRNLSFRGAEVVAPSALSYKDADMTVRVAHYQHGDLLAGGTSIEGQFENLIDLEENRLACVTIAGRAIRNSPGILGDLATKLGDEGINISANSSGMDSLTFYVNAEDAEDAEAVLHDAVVEDETLSSITVEENIAVIRVTGGELPNQPGSVKQVIDPLSDAHITIFDVITSATSVSVFVSYDDREQALKLVQNVF